MLSSVRKPGSYRFSGINSARRSLSPRLLALKVAYQFAPSTGTDSRLRRPRFELNVLDERHLIATFAVHKLIYETLGQ
jgi:hypothetical protein